MSKIIFPIGTSVPAQKFAIQVGRPHIVMPEKAGIQIRDFPGFRVALAIASLPGMTDELCSELLGGHTRSFNTPGEPREQQSQMLVRHQCYFLDRWASGSSRKLPGRCLFDLPDKTKPQRPKPSTRAEKPARR